MRNKFVALVLGLIVIMVTPVAFTACSGDVEQKTDQTELSQSDITADLSTLVYHAERPTGVSMLVSVNDEVVEADPVDVPEEVPLWVYIVGVILSFASVFFGTQYRSAIRVINAVAEAVDYGSEGGEKITVTEIKGIIKAFKNTDNG